MTLKSKHNLDHMENQYVSDNAVRWCTECLRKKYGVHVADYRWYFKIGNIQQCNIFRHDIYNCHLGVYEVSTPYVKCDLSYDMNMRGMMSQWWDLADKMAYLNTITYLLSKTSLTHHLSCVHNFSYLWHMGWLKLHTYGWKLFLSCLKILHFHIALSIKYC